MISHLCCCWLSLLPDPPMLILKLTILDCKVGKPTIIQQIHFQNANDLTHLFRTMKQFGFCEKIVKNLKILTFFAVSGSACCIETWLELKSITSRKVLSFLVLFLSPAMQAELQYSQFPLSASTLLHFIAATTKLVSIPNLTRMTAMAKEGTKTVQPC